MGFLAFRIMVVATSLAGDKSWREDLDRQLVDQMSSSEASRSSRASWSGQNCMQMSNEGRRTMSEDAPFSEDPRLPQGGSPAVRRI